jgi:hypothetical protein
MKKFMCVVWNMMTHLSTCLLGKCDNDDDELAMCNLWKGKLGKINELEFCNVLSVYC